MTRRFCARSFILAAAICAFSFAVRASKTDYVEAVKALEANDFPTALRFLESAVRDDPDNVRYASEYRQAAIRAKDFDRPVKFFEKLSSAHPDSANVHLNFGFAYVDKIPSAGSITQVILANNALKEFTRAVELAPNWIDYYTRGMSYLFWPKVFNRAPLGVVDLQKALEIQKKSPSKLYYVKTYIGLGDGYWKIDDLKKAHAIWKEGLKRFPDNAELKTRLAKNGDELKAAIEANFDPNKRVNTDLKELWANSEK